MGLPRPYSPWPRTGNRNNRYWGDGRPARPFVDGKPMELSGEKLAISLVQGWVGRAVPARRSPSCRRTAPEMCGGRFSPVSGRIASAHPTTCKGAFRLPAARGLAALPGFARTSTQQSLTFRFSWWDSRLEGRAPPPVHMPGECVEMAFHPLLDGRGRPSPPVGVPPVGRTCAKKGGPTARPGKGPVRALRG